MASGWTLEPASAPSAGWRVEPPAPARPAAPAPAPATGQGWRVEPPAAAPAAGPAWRVEPPAVDKASGRVPRALDPSERDLKARPYNPGREFMGNVRQRTANAGQEFMEGAHQFAPGDGQSADPVNAVVGGLKMAGGAWDAVGAWPAAAMDTVVGKPVQTATGTPKTFAGDAALQAGAFLGGGEAAKVLREPGMTREARVAEVGARVRGGEDLRGLTPPKAPAASGWKILKPAASAVRGKHTTRGPEMLAADEAHAGDEIFQEHQEGGPVVGTEADPVERVDNAMYRLGGHATADKLEAAQFLKGLPKELTDPKTQADLYDAIESRMVDPNYQIPDHLQPAMQAFDHYYKEQTEITNRLRERNDPSLDPYLDDSGYVARRVKGYTPLFDETPGARPRDPILGERSLFKTAQAQKQRTAGFVVTDADGTSYFHRGHPPETDILDRPWASQRQATTREIEANSDVRYHKNALVNTIDNVMRLRRVERNLTVLDEVTKGLKEQGLAFREKWTHRDPGTGWMVEQRANGKRPEGFVELPHVPQLRDWYFAPEVAQALQDYHPGPEKPLWEVLGKVNRLLTASLFVTPVPHAANVMAHWAVGRGWDWINPRGYARMMRTGTEAARQVLTMGPKYRQMLREGSALMYGDTATRDFHKLMLEKAGHEITDDPQALNLFAKAAGVPVELVKKVYTTANKMLWATGDIFMLQRQMELEAKGMSTRKAIQEAEKDIPNYRIPPQVMKQRWLSQAMASPNAMMFGRYKYGQLNAWGHMFKDLGSFKDPKTQFEALGKFLTAITISTVVYPMMDAALHEATGNKDARVKRAGPFSLTDAAEQMTKGQKDLAVALSSFFSPAPLVAEGLALLRNKDFFGRNIYTPGAGADLQAAEVGKYVAGSAVYPVQLALDAMKGNPAGAAGKLAGLELPTHKQVADRKMYAQQEATTGRERTARFRNRVKAGRYTDAVTKLGKE